MTALGRAMREWSDVWSRERRLPDYFAAAWRAAEHYYGAHAGGVHPVANFETVLAEEIALAHWVAPPPYGNALRGLVAPNQDIAGLAFPQGPYGGTVAVTDQVTFLLVSLAQHMRRACLSAEYEKNPVFGLYKQLLSSLRASFDVGIFNLNYDNAALTAWPNAFTGFSDAGNFDPEAVHAREAWDFMYQMHGSVHHSFDGPVSDAIRWNGILTGDFNDGDPGRATDTRTDSREFPRTTLVAGGFKLDQLLIEPFQTLYASLVRKVSRADAIIFGGYGFGDEHLNRAFQNHLGRGGIRPPILILTRSPEKTDPMQIRQDSGSLILSHALCAPGHFFVNPAHPAAAPVIPHLMERDGFEISPQHRVAIWHGGYVEAFRRIDDIKSWLDGTATDAVLAPR